MRRILAGIAAAMALFAVAACSSDNKSAAPTSGSSGSGGPTGSPVSVVIVAPTSAQGSFGVIGTQIANGGKAAADVLNANNGILGHPVKVEIIDDGGVPNNGIGPLQQRLQTGDKPILVEPGASSNEGVAYVPITTDAGVVSIGAPAATSLNDPAKYPLEFQVSPSPNLIAASLLQYFQSQNVHKLAMLSSTDAFGQSTLAATQSEAAKAGITLASETYNNADLDVTAPLQRLQAQSPDALYFEATGAAVGHVLDSRLKLGWMIQTVGDLDVSVTDLTSTTLVGTPQMQNVKIQVLKIQTYTPPEQRSPALQAFMDAAKKQGPITSSISPESFSYDSVMLAAAAAEQAKSMDPNAMKKALEELSAPSNPRWVTLADYKYTAQNHSPAAEPSNWTVVTPTHLVDGQYGAPGSG